VNPKYPRGARLKTVGLSACTSATRHSRAAVALVDLRARGQRADRSRRQERQAQGAVQLLQPEVQICKVNVIPPKPWDPTKVSAFPQPDRADDQFNLPIYANSAAARNAAAQQLLRSVNPKSVWANYQLISTMWPPILSSRSARRPRRSSPTPPSRPTSKGRCRTSRRTASSATTTPP